VRVTDDGRTVIDDTAKQMNCAMKWKDLEAFEDLLCGEVDGAVINVGLP